MTQASPTGTRIKSIADRLARLPAERSRLVVRASVSERKRDTRRKILIGGAVLAAVQHEGVPALQNMDALARWMDSQLTRGAGLISRANNVRSSASAGRCASDRADTGLNRCGGGTAARSRERAWSLPCQLSTRTIRAGDPHRRSFARLFRMVAFPSFCFGIREPERSEAGECVRKTVPGTVCSRDDGSQWAKGRVPLAVSVKATVDTCSPLALPTNRHFRVSICVTYT